MPRIETISLKKTQAGFALVIALSLMAFVLLLMLSMTLLVQVETRGSSIGKAQLQARESVHLALMMAIGDLQKHAGPDQRVTARAEITGGALAASNPHWTGVWDTTNQNAPPRWMVSWRDQTNSPTNRTLEILGSGSLDSNAPNYQNQRVRAPSISVTNSTGQTTDEIAWWISDEGVKTSLGSLPLNIRASDPNFAERSDLSLMLGTSQGIETLFTDYDRFTSIEATLLDQITSPSQLLSRDAFSDETSRSFNNEDPFHILTLGSFGVLASVLPNDNGGLMSDLSLYPNLLGNGFVEYLEVAEANSETLNSSDENSVAHYRLYQNIKGQDNIGPLNDGDIATPVTPILSNFMLGFTIRCHSPVGSNPNFYLRMRFVSEFWNPFTHSIKMTDQVGNPINLELEITGLPTVVTMGIPDSDDEDSAIEQSAPLDLQDFLGDPTKTDTPLVIRLNYDHTKEWLPGQSMNWTGVDADENATTSPYDSLSTETSEKDWDASRNTLGGERGIDTGLPRFTGNLRHESAGNNLIRVKVFEVNEAAGIRRLITQYGDMNYERVSNRSTGYSNTHRGATFGYHYVLRGPHFSSDDPEYFRGRWLHDYDPRNPSPIFYPDWQLDFDQESEIGSAFVPVTNGIQGTTTPDPANITETPAAGATRGSINTNVFKRLTDRSRTNRLYPAMAENDPENKYNLLWQDAPLFELPRARVLSLASLQHLYFHNERPFQVGNSWGSDGNTNTLAWFDRYYFSGFSRNDSPRDYNTNLSLPNPTLVPYKLNDIPSELEMWQATDATDEPASRTAAAKFLVANRFNLNSTSISAWSSVLGSLRINGWSHLDYPEDTSNLSAINVSNETRENMFARYSHSLSETYDATETPQFEGSGSFQEKVAPSAFYRHGARHFTNTEITSFAEEIVRLIKLKGQPFFSIEEFLSADPVQGSSVMEQAIANTFADNGIQKWDHLWEVEGTEKNPSREIEVDHFSPGFLTQADVMTAIGPMLAPRSDTFKIRAKAVSYNVLGEVSSTATIEAILQRTPEAQSSTSTNTNSANRAFKLLRVRWLNEDEI